MLAVPPPETGKEGMAKGIRGRLLWYLCARRGWRRFAVGGGAVRGRAAVAGAVSAQSRGAVTVAHGCFGRH